MPCSEMSLPIHCVVLLLSVETTMLAAESADATAWWTYLVTALSVTAFLLALLSIPSVVIQRSGRPQAALTWVLVLFLLPFIGLIFWWAIGRQHLKRKRRKRQRTLEDRSERLADVADELPAQSKQVWTVLPVHRLPEDEAEWAYSPTSGNHVELLVDAEQAYPEMVEAIRSAKRFVHVLFYIWNQDDTGRRFRDLLAERAKEGVEVRALYDAFGGFGMGRRFIKPLKDAGAQVAVFAPPVFLTRSLELNFRNHRKIIVADGSVAVMGGLNIGDEYLHHWRDAALKLSGPVVDQLQDIFADDWYFATGDDFADRSYFGQWADAQHNPPGDAMCGIVASGPHNEVNLTHEAFFTVINRAQQRIWITTPYFVPDQPILAALRSAVFRGVDLRILVPHKSDNFLTTLASRAYYHDLLRAGVRIFEFDDGFLHAKTAVIDDVCVVGSANMDIRSFRLNFEVSCFVKSGKLSKRLMGLFEHYLSSSREITLEGVQDKPYRSKLAESFAQLLSPLL